MKFAIFDGVRSKKCSCSTQKRHAFPGLLVLGCPQNLALWFRKHGSPEARPTISCALERIRMASAPRPVVAGGLSTGVLIPGKHSFHFKKAQA